MKPFTFLSLLGVAAAQGVRIDWDCQATPPIGGPQQLSLNNTVQGDAPSAVKPGDVFNIMLASNALTIPATAAGFPINTLRDIKLSVPVPPGTSHIASTLAGGSKPATVAEAGGVVTISVADAVAGGAAFNFPLIHLNLAATGAVGNVIESRLAGRGYASPGLRFVANIKVGIINLDVPTACFPAGSPALTRTTIEA